MVFLVAVVVFVALPGLLFDEHLKVFLHHVHTSLQPQFFADERGLEQGAFLVEMPDVAGQYIMYKRTDVHHLGLRLGMEVGRNLTGTEIKGRGGKEFLDATRVGDRLLGLFVDVVVEKLAGQVTHQDGSRMSSRLDFIHEIVERMMSVFPETGRQRTDVNQVIGVDDDKVRNVMVLFVHPHIEQVQGQVLRQQFFQIQQIALIASFGIVDDDEGISITVGGCKYLSIVPAGHGSPYVRNVRQACALIGTVGVRDFRKDGSRNVFFKAQRDKAYQGTQVVKVFLHVGLKMVAHGSVAVAAHGLDGIPVGGSHLFLLADVVQTRKQVGKGKGDPRGQFITSLLQYFVEQDVFGL